MIRKGLDISWYLLSRYGDDPGDFIGVVNKINTLTQSKKSRANNGSTLAHPLLRNLYGFIQQGSVWPQSFGMVKG